MGKKKILLIIIPIILLIMIGAGIFAFLYLATDMFKSDKELFMKSISQSYEIMDVFENENVKEQNDFKLTNTYTSSGNLNLSITENGDTKNINLTTASRRDNNTGRKYSEVALKNGTNDLLKASYVNSGDVYAIKCDDILGLYMGFKDSGFKEYAQKLGLSEDDIKKIPDSINFEGIYQLSDLTDEQKKYIIETYSKVIFDSIPEDKFSKLNGSQITVGDKTYSANAYTLNLSGSEIKQIIINCLTALQQDNTSLVIISNKLSDVGIPAEYTDITVLAQTIERMTADVQENLSIDSDIILTIYESQMKVIKAVIQVGDEGRISIDNESNGNEKKVVINIEAINEQGSLNIYEDDKSTGVVEQNNTIESNTNGINDMTTNYMVTNDVSSFTNNIGGNGNTEIIGNSVGQNSVENVTNNVDGNAINSVNEDIQTMESTGSQPINSINSDLETSSNATMQIILQKSVTDSNTVNSITILPDASSSDSILMTTNLGKVQDGKITNEGEITISEDMNTVKSVYMQNIEVASEVEEIPELKNSDSVIINNYTIEQLMPFVNGISSKVQTVIPSKISQLGLNSYLGNQGGAMALMSTLNILNVNGINIQKIGGTALFLGFVVGDNGLMSNQNETGNPNTIPGQSEGEESETTTGQNEVGNQNTIAGQNEVGDQNTIAGQNEIMTNEQSGTNTIANENMGNSMSGNEVNNGVNNESAIGNMSILD